jgi:hypothetical protein
MLFTPLLQRGLQALEHLLLLASCHCHASVCHSHLELNLGLSNVSLAAASAGNLLGLGDLVPDSLIAILATMRPICPLSVLPQR